MTVSDLRRILDSIPSDARVVVPDFDHRFRDADCVEEVAGLLQDNELVQWDGPDEAEAGERPVTVLVVR